MAFNIETLKKYVSFDTQHISANDAVSMKNKKLVDYNYSILEKLIIKEAKSFAQAVEILQNAGWQLSKSIIDSIVANDSVKTKITKPIDGVVEIKHPE